MGLHRALALEFVADVASFSPLALFLLATFSRPSFLALELFDVFDAVRRPCLFLLIVLIAHSFVFVRLVRRLQPS
jgi:hypothetical protein